MIPSIATIAILTLASLSSVITSSSRGPAARICLALEEKRLPTRLLKFPRTLKASKISKMIANIIHPRPRRDGGVAAGGMITGGGSGGGGGAAGTAGGGVWTGGGDEFS